MSQATEFAQLQRLPPAEAIAYMAGRDLTGETYHWHDLWRSEYERSFTVSRLARADLLEAVQASISKSVAGDLTRRDWIRDTEQLLKVAGWWGKVEVTDPRTGEVLSTRFNHARLQLIFDTNTRQAAAAGQWQRMLRNQRTQPYARYVAMDDDRTRPQHRAWNNVTLPLADPWWATHRPPNGYRCRCRIVGVSQREYDQGSVSTRPGAETDVEAPVVQEPMVKTAPKEVMRPWRNPATGEVHQVPDGIDPGFDYNAGTDGRSKAFDEMVRNKLAKLSAPVAQAALAGRLRTGLPDEAFMGQRPGLFELPPIPITSLAGDEFGAGLTHVELMKQVEAALRELQGSDGLVNEDAGWLLMVNKKSREKMGDNKAQSRPSLQAVAALKALVQRAVVAERHADVKRQNRNVLAIYRLFVPAEIAGKLYRVKLTVKDLVAPDNVSKLLHALDTAEIEGAPLGTLPAAVSAGDSITGQGQPTTGRLMTIADLLRGAELQGGGPFAPGN